MEVSGLPNANFISLVRQSECAHGRLVGRRGALSDLTVCFCDSMNAPFANFHPWAMENIHHVCAFSPAPQATGTDASVLRTATLYLSARLIGACADRGELHVDLCDQREHRCNFQTGQELRTLGLCTASRRLLHRRSHVGAVWNMHAQRFLAIVFEFAARQGEDESSAETGLDGDQTAS